ncbi:MAG: tetratricopeptide repeat-containing sensor histidine kinase [Prolixibacteraceae bacterium]
MRKIILFIVVLFSISTSAQNPVDSLLSLCNSGDEKQLSNWYLEISTHFPKDTLTSNQYIRKAYQLAVKNKYVPEQAKAIFYLGDNTFNSFNYNKSLLLYNKALKLYASLNDSLNIAICHKTIGQSYFSLYQNQKAVTEFIEGLKYCEADKETTAKLVYNIGRTHLRMHNINVADNNFRKALALNQEINNLSGIAANYNGLGMAFKSINRLDSALIYYVRAHAIYRKIKRKDNMAIALSNIAGIYLNYNDSIKKSINYYNQAWDIFNDIGWYQYEAEIRQGIGFAFYKLGRYDRAIENYKISMEVNDKYNQGIQIKTTNYDLLSRAYEKTQNYQKALEYNKLFMQYTDSLHQKEKYEEIMNLEKNYEIQKKENEIIKLQSKQELIDVQLRKNKQLKLLGFVTTLLLLGFVFFVLIKYFDKIKSNKVLAEKNQIIKESEHELRLLNAAKNKFFSIIAHDLKNPLHSVMGYSMLLSNEYEKFTENERRKFAKDINQSTNNIFRLLQNLLEWTRSQTGQLNFEPLEVEFKKLIENSANVLYSVAQQKNISISIDYNEDLKLFADPQMIETVLRNLINNAIKFTPENGEIEISAKENGQKVEIKIRDSGIGISENDLQNLFKIDSKVKRKGTNNEDGSGLGLILCKEFVEKNNGMLWVESFPGQGSSFFFSIPSKKIA